MEHHPLLRSLEYSILHSEDDNSRHFFRRRKDRAAASTMVNVKVDFEHGNFFLERSSAFMTGSDKKGRKRRAARKQEWMRIESALYPSLPLDLADEKNPNYHFTLHGIIQDDVVVDSCSGMLTVEQIKYSDGGMTGEWVLTFYLSNIVGNECEMKINLLLLPEQEYGVLN